MLTDFKILAFAAVLSAFPAFASNRIKADETVIFFPTCGIVSETDAGWRAPVNGWIFEPEDDSLMRAGLLKLFKILFGSEWDGEEADFFEKRAHLFLSDSERGKSLKVALSNGAVMALEPTGPDGRIFGEFRSSAGTPRPETFSSGGTDGWTTYQVKLPAGDNRLFIGRVQLLSETGISIISDLDDTIKDSRVTDRKELIANTFLRPFRPVPGMAGLYRQWAERGVAFHYVSASPRQLYFPIAKFLKDEAFPMGSLDLRIFRPHGDLSNLFSPSAEVKKAAIEALLERFPRRSFALVGDSGEGDPELYGELARKRPNEIVRIFIRDIKGEGAESPRFKKAFFGIPANRWTVFSDPAEIADLLPFSQ